MKEISGNSKEVIFQKTKLTSACKSFFKAFPNAQTIRELEMQIEIGNYKIEIEELEIERNTLAKKHYLFFNALAEIQQDVGQAESYMKRRDRLYHLGKRLYKKSIKET